MLTFAYWQKKVALKGKEDCEVCMYEVINQSTGQSTFLT